VGLYVWLLHFVFLFLQKNEFYLFLAHFDDRHKPAESWQDGVGPPHEQLLLSFKKMR